MIGRTGPPTLGGPHFGPDSTWAYWLSFCAPPRTPLGELTALPQSAPPASSPAAGFKGAASRQGGERERKEGEGRRGAGRGEGEGRLALMCRWNRAADWLRPALARPLDHLWSFLFHLSPQNLRPATFHTLSPPMCEVYWQVDIYT